MLVALMLKNLAIVVSMTALGFEILLDQSLVLPLQLLNCVQPVLEIVGLTSLMAQLGRWHQEPHLLS